MRRPHSMSPKSPPVAGGWEFGCNFRNTLGFPNQADAPQDVYHPGNIAYPTLLTNGDAVSTDVGFDTAAGLAFDGDATADPRLAGVRYGATGPIWTIVLDGPGQYSIDVALGGFPTSGIDTFMSDRWPWQPGVFFREISFPGASGDDRAAANNVLYANSAAWLAADGVRQFTYDFQYVNLDGKQHFSMWLSGAGRQLMHVRMIKL